MCDCATTCRRVCCRDWCDDCIECGESVRSICFDFGEGFTSEACHSLYETCLASRVCVCASCAKSFCTGVCESDARDTGRNCGRGIAEFGNATGSACCCVFTTVSRVPGFLLGFVIVAGGTAVVVWILLHPGFLGQKQKEIAQTIDFINKTVGAVETIESLG